MSFTLEDLNNTILARAEGNADKSYTAQLLSKGVAHCAQKLGEEAVETAIAAVLEDKADMAAEASDLLYHLLVLLKASDVTLEDVMDELQKRTARSGLEEKASR